MKRDHLRVVTAWLNDLANLCTGQLAPDELKVRLAALSQALAVEFTQAEAFTRESVYAVSRHCTFLPSYAELSKLLGDWWAQHKPRETGAALPDAEELSSEERVGAIVWLDAKAYGFALQTELGGRGAPDPERGVMRLAVLRRYQPRAFRWLCNHDDLAASIAVRHGWSADVDRPAGKPTEAEHEAVSTSARRAIEGLVAARPAAPQSAPFSRPMAAPARALVVLTPAQLEAARTVAAERSGATRLPALASPSPTPAANMQETPQNPPQEGAAAASPSPASDPPLQNAPDALPAGHTIAPPRKRSPALSWDTP